MTLFALFVPHSQNKRKWQKMWANGSQSDGWPSFISFVSQFPTNTLKIRRIGIAKAERKRTTDPQHRLSLSLLFGSSGETRLVMNIVPSDDILLTSRRRGAHREDVLVVESSSQQFENVFSFGVIREIGSTCCSNIRLTRPRIQRTLDSRANLVHDFDRGLFAAILWRETGQRRRDVIDRHLSVRRLRTFVQWQVSSRPSEQCSYLCPCRRDVHSSDTSVCHSIGTILRCMSDGIDADRPAGKDRTEWHLPDRSCIEQEFHPLPSRMTVRPSVLRTSLATPCRRRWSVELPSSEAKTSPWSSCAVGEKSRGNIPSANILSNGGDSGDSGQVSHSLSDHVDRLKANWSLIWFWSQHLPAQMWLSSMNVSPLSCQQQGHTDWHRSFESWHWSQMRCVGQAEGDCCWLAMLCRHHEQFSVDSTRASLI